MPKQRSTLGQTTRLRGGGTDTSSAKQRPTRGISTRSCGSGSNSSSAMGSQGTPSTRDNIPVLIQEVVQSLMKRSSLRHSEQSSMENTSDQPTPVSNTAPSTPLRTIHRLQMTFMDWYSKYVKPSQKTTIPYIISCGHSASP